MTTVAHSTLTGADLHDAKGVATATSGQVYVANGSGTGVWTNQTNPGVVEIVTQNVTGQTFVNFQTAVGGVVFDTTYDTYTCVFSGVTGTAASATLTLQFGTGSGPTYQTTGYSWNIVAGSILTISAATALSQAAVNTSSIGLINGGGSDLITNATGATASGRIYFSNPGVSVFPVAHSYADWSNGTAVFHSTNVGGWFTQSVITAFRIGISAGTMSGRFTLFGDKKA